MALAGPEKLAGVHPDIAHLSWLIGTWNGFGVGDGAAAEPFQFEEVVQFAEDGRGFVEYRSVSWLVDDQRQRLEPARTESGFWRPLPDNGVEALIVQSHGVSELCYGKVEVTSIVDARITGARLLLKSDAILTAESGLRLDSTTRMLGLVGGKLYLAYDRALPEQPEANHLAIELSPSHV